MPVETELYDILEVNPDSSQDEIKKAYRRQALTHHPDKGGDTEKFKQLNSAYEILSDPEKRKVYDMRGKRGLQDSGNVPDDILNSMFGGLFGNMFNMFGGGNFGNVNRKTLPVSHTIQVTLEDICRRKVVKLKISRDRVCNCYGVVTMNCTDCGGTGVKTVTRQMGPMTQRMNSPCLPCEGKGKIYQYCGNCQKGTKEETKVLEVHLTPDMSNGYKYTFQNEGNQEKDKEVGDFIVIVEYKTHPKFKVEKRNLIYEKEITLKEALCGFIMQIEHPSGESIVWETEKVTTPETVVPFENGLGGLGKLYVKFKIVFPEKISPETREVISKIVF